MPLACSLLPVACSLPPVACSLQLVACRTWKPFDTMCILMLTLWPLKNFSFTRTRKSSCFQSNIKDSHWLFIGFIDFDWCLHKFHRCSCIFFVFLIFIYGLIENHRSEQEPTGSTSLKSRTHNFCKMEGAQKVAFSVRNLSSQIHFRSQLWPGGLFKGF